MFESVSLKCDGGSDQNGVQRENECLHWFMFWWSVGMKIDACPKAHVTVVEGKKWIYMGNENEIRGSYYNLFLLQSVQIFFFFI